MSEFSACKFVPGTVYKSRGGEVYRFVAYVPDAIKHSRAVFLHLRTGGVISRRDDGRFNSGEKDVPADILPNKKTCTIYVYRKENQLVATTESPRSPGYGWELIGEVTEEYEEY